MTESEFVFGRFEYDLAAVMLGVVAVGLRITVGLPTIISPKTDLGLSVLIVLGIVLYDAIDIKNTSGILR